MLENSQRTPSLQGRSQCLHNCRRNNCHLWKKHTLHCQLPDSGKPWWGHSITNDLTKVSSEQQAALSGRLCSAWRLQEAHLRQAEMQNASTLDTGGTKDSRARLLMRWPHEPASEKVSLAAKQAWTPVSALRPGGSPDPSEPPSSHLYNGNDGNDIIFHHWRWCNLTVA